MHEYRKWYGKNVNGEFAWYAGLEDDPQAVFEKLSGGMDVQTVREKPGSMPDLREAMIGYGKTCLRNSLGEDWKLVKLINVYFSMDELINTLYEKSLSLSLITGEHNGKEQFFRDLAGSGNEGMKTIGNLGNEMILRREELWGDIQRKMEAILPGSCRLAGTLTVAELLAHFGNIERLAMSRSSSIQMAGAEKSLFISKMKGVKNPKYGLIYKCPVVSSAPAPKRGKVARKLAGKLTICIRADFSGNPIQEDQIDRMKEKVTQA